MKRCFSAMAQSQSQRPERHPWRAAKWEPKPQEMFVSYWTLEPGWSTQLEIRNNVRHPMRIHAIAALIERLIS